MPATCDSDHDHIAGVRHVEMHLPFRSVAEQERLSKTVRLKSYDFRCLSRIEAEDIPEHCMSKAIVQTVALEIEAICSSPLERTQDAFEGRHIQLSLKPSGPDVDFTKFESRHI